MSGVLACGTAEPGGSADGGAPGGNADASGGPAVDATTSPADGDVTDATTIGDGAFDDAAIDPDGASTDGQLPPGGDGGPLSPDAAALDGGSFPITPSTATVALGGTVELTLGAPAGAAPGWAVDGVALGSAALGRLSVGADPRVVVYTAPDDPRALPPVSHVVSATVGAARGEATVALVYPGVSISGLAPDRVDAGSSTTTVVVTGTGFSAGTVADLEGLPAPSRALSTSTLEVDVSQGRLRYPGMVRLNLRNPAPGGGAASATLLIVLRETVVPRGLDPAVPGLFEAAPVGTVAARRPVITYPEDNSFAPRDFPAPVVSWTQAAPTNVCRMRLSSPGAIIDVFTSTAPRPASQNPQAAIPASTWIPVVNSAPRPAPFTVDVRCAEVERPAGQPVRLVGNVVHQSTPRTYTVAAELATGRIAYFSGSISGLARIDVRPDIAPPRAWVGPGPNFEFSVNYCVGCHSFSQSGARMSFTAIIGGTQANLGALDLSGTTPALTFQQFTPGVAEWTSLHPSGAVIISQNTAGTLNLHDSTNGQFIIQVPTTTHATVMTQPAWSGDGTALAFTGSNQPQNYGPESVRRGSIYTMSYSNAGGTHTFGPVRRVADPGSANGNAYYPAYSPDGQWIAFCRAAAGGESYNNADGRVWLVKADGTVGPILLARASQARANNTNSWPRWSPVASGGRYYLMFSSVRDYPPLNGTGPQQLWVSQIDTNRLPADPSAPAIWLSGQDPFTINLAAEWTSSL